MGPDCYAITAAAIAVAAGFMDADFSTLCPKNCGFRRGRAFPEVPAFSAETTHREGFLSNPSDLNRPWHRECSSGERG